VRRTQRRLSAYQRKAAEEFALAVWQLPCAVCGLAPRYSHDAHHVIEAQYLRRNHPDYIYDKRNALPLCRRCHGRHTSAFSRVPLSQLTDDNLGFVHELLGEYAEDYLHRYYSE